MTEHVRLEVANGVGRLILDRPDKRNALTRDMLQEIRQHAESTSGDESVRVLRLESTGPVFCAGMDLDEMQSRADAADARQQWDEDARTYREAIWSIVKLPIPVVAVVQGPVLAGGVGLVAACDLVLAAEQATFSLPEPKRGITAAVVTPLLLHRVGVSTASRLLLSLREFSANEALATGFCHAVVEGDLESEADAWTESILEGSRTALKMTKQFLLHCAADHLRSQLESGTSVSASARATPDAREGLAAFLEKRRPAWGPKE